MDPTSPADRLVDTLRGYGRTLVAFSGGVDSSVVLAAATRALGSERVAAVTAVSPSLPAAELAAAREFCADLGVAHHTVETGSWTGWATAAMDRTAAISARRHCWRRRPSWPRRAATPPSPRAPTPRTWPPVSGRASALPPSAAPAPPWPTWDWTSRRSVTSPGHGACQPRTNRPPRVMSSRIAYGISITRSRLARVERAEAALRPLLAGFGVRNLRVRDLGQSVRLEVDAAAVAAVRDHPLVRAVIRTAGFGDASLTVEPFRSGSMNDLLSDPDRWR